MSARVGTVWWGVAAAGAAGLAVAGDRAAVVRRAPRELRTPVAYLPITYSAAALPWIRRGAAIQELLAPTAKVAGVSTRHLTVPAGDGRPAVGILVSERPDRPRDSAALLWIHGGGYVSGTAGQSTQRCRRWARRENVLVASVDYRLAPEHPFPAGLDDCFAALAWLHENAAALRIDPSRIAVGGDSAGGGLAACLAQRAHDAGLPVAFQLLVYPMLDDRTCLRTPPTGVGELLWTPASNRFGWASYLGHEPGAEAPDYAVAARRERLAGLAPAWIGVGSIDLFAAEGAAYAARLAEAGVPTAFELVEDFYHGADVAAPRAPQTAAFQEAQDAALRAGLGLDR